AGADLGPDLPDADSVPAAVHEPAAPQARAGPVPPPAPDHRTRHGLPLRALTNRRIEMAVEVREFHHTALCVPHDRVEEVIRFYQDVLGLVRDPSRPQMGDIPGGWLWVGPGRTAQLHVIGVGPERLGVGAALADEDPVRPHVALAVEDLTAAKK